MKKLFILFLLLTILLLWKNIFASNNELELKSIVLRLSQNIVSAAEYLSSTANRNKYKSAYGSNIKVPSSAGEAENLNVETARLITESGVLNAVAENLYEQTVKIQGPVNNSINSNEESISQFPSAALSIAEDSPHAWPVFFFGDSITKGMEQFNYFPEAHIKAEIGLGTTGALAYADSIAEIKPSKLFILLGINDFWEGGNLQAFINNYRTIVSTIRNKSPGTKIYIQSIFPLGKTALDRNKKINNSIIDNINSELQDIAAEMNAVYIDINTILKDSEGNLQGQYTSDGIHIEPECYKVWADFLSKYVDD